MVTMHAAMPCMPNMSLIRAALLESGFMSFTFPTGACRRLRVQAAL